MSSGSWPCGSGMRLLRIYRETNMQTQNVRYIGRACCFYRTNFCRVKHQQMWGVVAQVSIFIFLRILWTIYHQQWMLRINWTVAYIARISPRKTHAYYIVFVILKLKKKITVSVLPDAHILKHLSRSFC